MNLLAMINDLIRPFLADIQAASLQAPADIQAHEINFFTILPADIMEE